MCVLVTRSCLTLCNPMDCSPPGSLVPGILQGRILEWLCSSWGSSWPTDWTWVSHIAGRFFTVWATIYTLLKSLKNSDGVQVGDSWKDRRETHLETGHLCCDQSHLHSDHPVLHSQEINTGIACIPWPFKCNFILKLSSMDINKIAISQNCI